MHAVEIIFISIDMQWSIGMLNQRRGSIEICGEILRLAAEGRKRTHIMHGANLSYDLLKKYMGYLEGRNFVRCNASDGTYHLTVQGNQLLQEIRDVENMMSPHRPG